MRPARIASAGLALPRHAYPQEVLLEAFKKHWGREHHNLERLERLHKNVLVGERHLALPLEEYEKLETFGQSNDAWIRVARELGAAAVRDAVERAGLCLRDIGALITVTVTGVATPSLDARIMNDLHLPTDVVRMPIFGLGCVAGAAGVARAADWVSAHPGQVAVLLSVELCSLTLQREDLSVANLIAGGLFGDGAAAVVLVGGGYEVPTFVETGPSILATRSVFYPGTEDVMGWRISERGFQVVLTAEVPEMVRKHLRRDVDSFLGEHDLTRADIRSWVCHPGGPKVLLAMQEALDLSEDDLALTWKSLRELGNMSSTSVLQVLRTTLLERRPEPGSWGVMLAMGPGFCTELVLLRW